MKKNKLFFDSSFKNLNLAILDKNYKLINKLVIPTNNNLTEIALENLNNFLKENKIKPKQIDSFYVTLGPGSFTGIRMGCIISKTWCTINTECKLYAIDSLRLQVPHTDGISVLDARGNKEYYAIYRGGIGVIGIAENSEFEKLCKLNQDLPLYKNYENINIFESLVNNLENFSLVEKPINLVPIYVKPPVN